MLFIKSQSCRKLKKHFNVFYVTLVSLKKINFSEVYFEAVLKNGKMLHE